MNSFGKKSDTEINSYIDLGRNYFSQEKFSEAVECFLNALRSDPDHTSLTAHDVFYFVGESYRKLDQLDVSIKYLEQALTFFEATVGDIDTWQIYLALARALRESPNYDASKWMPYYQKLADALPPLKKKLWLPWFGSKPISPSIAEGILEAYFYLGLYQLFEKSYDNAVYSLTKSIHSGSEMQPIFTKAHFFLGRAYLHSNNNRKALEVFHRLIKVDPKFEWVDEASVYHDIGQVYYKENQYKESLEYRLKILDLEGIEPELLADVHLGLGHTCYSLKLFKEAVEHYKKCMKLTSPESSIRRTAIEYMVSANEALAEQN